MRFRCALHTDMAHGFEVFLKKVKLRCNLFVSFLFMHFQILYIFHIKNINVGNIILIEQFYCQHLTVNSNFLGTISQMKLNIRRYVKVSKRAGDPEISVSTKTLIPCQIGVANFFGWFLSHKPSTFHRTLIFQGIQRIL